MDHRKRIEQTLSGEIPDRPPVALWRHFPVDDQDPHRMASAHIAFQKMYDFDLVKVTPESSYMVKGWGVQDQWRGNSEGTREYIQRGIQEPEDWLKVRPLPPDSGILGDQLRCLRAIQSAFGPKTPVLMTIFSPLGQARKLAGEQRLMVHMRRHPEAVREALHVITQTTLDFIEAVGQTGAAGIFYALQFAQYGKLSGSEFDVFCMPYHRQVLQAAGEMWLNILHLHGEHVMFERAAGLPAQVLNWHDRETSPDLETGHAQFAGVVCGGLRQWDTMVLGTPESVRAEAKSALVMTGGRRFILGTGCVTPITAPHGNLMAARGSFTGA